MNIPLKFRAYLSINFIFWVYIKWVNQIDIFLLGWSKSPFSFFNEIKDTFFIFTSNFIDLNILSRSAIYFPLLVSSG